MTPWLTIRLSRPSAAASTIAWSGRRRATPRVSEARCQIRLKSPRWLAARNTPIGERVVAQVLEQRVGGGVEGVRLRARSTRPGPGTSVSTPASASAHGVVAAAHRCLDCGPRRVAAVLGAPALVGAEVQSVLGLGRKSSRSQAVATAFHTALVRVVMKRVDCDDGTAVITSPDLRYIRRTAAGMPAEHRFAEEGVELHAAEALALEVGTGRGRSCSR